MDGAFRLTAAAEPFEHRDTAGFSDIGRAALMLQNVQHGTTDGQLVPQREGAEGSKRTQDVEWSRQEARLKSSYAPLRIDQEEPIKELDLIGAPDAAIKVLEISAAAKGHVLAIVHVLAVRQDVRRCAPAEEGTLFKQTYAPAGVSQRDAGCQSRQPAADRDEHHFFRFGKTNALPENGEVQQRDAAEQRAVSMNQQPQRAAAVSTDESEQSRTFFVELPSAFGLEAQQFANAESRFAAAKVFRWNSVTLQVFFRKIDTADFEILVNVANDVRQLKGEAELFCQVQGPSVAEAEHVRASDSHRAGHAITVFAEAIEGRICPNH